MNKNILIGILIVISFLSVVYSFFQHTAAKKAQIQAEANLVLAEQARKEADVNAMEAQKQAELARAMADAARANNEQMQQQLDKCKGRK